MGNNKEPQQQLDNKEINKISYTDKRNRYFESVKSSMDNMPNALRKSIIGITVEYMLTRRYKSEAEPKGIIQVFSAVGSYLYMSILCLAIGVLFIGMLAPLYMIYPLIFSVQWGQWQIFAKALSVLSILGTILYYVPMIFNKNSNYHVEDVYPQLSKKQNKIIGISLLLVILIAGNAISILKSFQITMDVAGYDLIYVVLASMGAAFILFGLLIASISFNTTQDPTLTSILFLAILLFLVGGLAGLNADSQGVAVALICIGMFLYIIYIVIWIISVILLEQTRALAETTVRSVIIASMLILVAIVCAFALAQILLTETGFDRFVIIFSAFITGMLTLGGVGITLKRQHHIRQEDMRLQRKPLLSCPKLIVKGAEVVKLMDPTDNEKFTRSMDGNCTVYKEKNAQEYYTFMDFPVICSDDANAIFCGAYINGHFFKACTKTVLLKGNTIVLYQKSTLFAKDDNTEISLIFEDVLGNAYKYKLESLDMEVVYAEDGVFPNLGSAYICQGELINTTEYNNTNKTANSKK